MWACSLAAIPWLRGIPAEAYVHRDGAAEDSRSSETRDAEARNEEEERREMARLADPEADLDVSQFVFRRYVEEVRVSFSVRGRDGHPIVGVTPKDFQLYENMNLVDQITAFDRNTETPRRMAVLLDSSGSVESEFAILKSTVIEVLSGVVRPGQDEAMITGFGGHGLHQLTPFTDSIDQMRSAVASLHPSGPTAFYDTMVQITEDKYWSSPGKPRAQRVLLLFTDGEDNLSMHTLREATAAVSGSNYYVYAVVVRPRSQSSEAVRALQELTASNGGRVFEMRHANDLQRALETIDADLKAQYSVAYRRPAESRAGFKEISIIPNDNNWVIRSRAGYIARPRD